MGDSRFCGANVRVMTSEMNIICLGLNHKTATVDIRERFAIQEPEMEAAIRKFREIEGVKETVIVSTCNRVEFYAVGEDLVEGFHALDHFLKEHSGLSKEDLEVLYRYDLHHSVQHLFRVVSGLDSMVIGETEILGQVKNAYNAALQSGVTSKILNRLFQKAFQVAKVVRTKTKITRGAVSVGAVAVELAGKIFGKLQQCHVMVLGAGEMSERTIRALQGRGVENITVSNRSLERAQELAERIGAKAVSLDQWKEQVRQMDILITSTSATHPIVTYDILKPIMVQRMGRPLFIIDIAVPRDVDEEVQRIENVYLYDIDSLQAIANDSLQLRSKEIETCEAIIQEHVEEFFAWLEKENERRARRETLTG